MYSQIQGTSQLPGGRGGGRHSHKKWSGMLVVSVEGNKSRILVSFSVHKRNATTFSFQSTFQSAGEEIIIKTALISDFRLDFRRLLSPVYKRGLFSCTGTGNGVFPFSVVSFKGQMKLKPPPPPPPYWCPSIFCAVRFRVLAIFLLLQNYTFCRWTVKHCFLHARFN